MAHKSIGYHTRRHNDNTVKVCGGSFGGAVDMETVNRLIKSHFTVKVRESGMPVFVDKEGREVTLYITVDPFATDAGKVAQAEYLKEQEKLQQVERDKSARIDELLSGMSNDEILQRLSDSPKG